MSHFITPVSLDIHVGENIQAGGFASVKKCEVVETFIENKNANIITIVTKPVAIKLYKDFSAAKIQQTLKFYHNEEETFLQLRKYAQTNPGDSRLSHLIQPLYHFDQLQNFDPNLFIHQTQKNADGEHKTIKTQIQINSHEKYTLPLFKIFPLLGQDAIDFNIGFSLQQNDSENCLKERLSHIVTMFGDVLKALSLLHELGIVHRDIKPENILFNPSNSRWVVIDYGFSTLVSHLGSGDKKKMWQPYGTPDYESLYHRRSWYHHLTAAVAKYRSADVDTQSSQQFYEWSSKDDLFSLAATMTKLIFYLLDAQESFVCNGFNNGFVFTCKSDELALISNNIFKLFFPSINDANEFDAQLEANYHRWKTNCKILIESDRWQRWMKEDQHLFEKVHRIIQWCMSHLAQASNVSEASNVVNSNNQHHSSPVPPPPPMDNELTSASAALKWFQST